MSIDHEYDTAQLARLAGISSRTLRHYDAIGLVRPASTRADGRRLYGRTEVLRLQRVLILRALGLQLERIAEVLDTPIDEVEALREHRAQLTSQQRDLERLIATVDRTIIHLEGGLDMSPEDVFDGLPGYDAAAQKEYADEAADRWGSEAVQASQARAQGLSRDQAAAVMEEHEVIARGVAELSGAGVAVDDPAAQALVARHHAWVCTFWTPDADAYVGLGRMYVDDERFRANYDRYGSGTAQYLCDAIEVYAERSLQP